MQKPNDKDGTDDNKTMYSASCEKQSLHCLPSDLNIRKQWINFIFNEVSDSVSKNLVLCSLHFSMDSFANKAWFDAGFLGRLKLKDDAVSATPFKQSILMRGVKTGQNIAYNF